METTTTCTKNQSSQSIIPGINESELVQLRKPAQYVGGEKNAAIKDDTQVNVRFALAFPDTYEVGMSHVGIQILYKIINDDPEAWAERAYMPLPDMEELLREKKTPLRSLEAKRPLKEFDLLGFSLQYELCGTNILAMLDLAHIPLWAKDRSEDDPIVIGGGPYSYHPESLAPFFDVFFLGDAEEFIPEVIALVRSWNTSDTPPARAQKLARLSEVEGIYVPSQFEPQYDEDGKLTEVRPLNPDKPKVIRRLLPTMEGAPFPERPVVPNIQAVHNRLSVEVMRGCVRGCRFCQAGYLYRPQRERPPEEIVKIIQTALPQTGYEEVSLLSLSTADYCSVVPLLKSLMDKYGEGDELAISFPSTRVDALTPEVLEQVQRVRRTGFTVAPEGGSQRLRDVINKGVTDEQILETCSNVFRMGWTGIKLYFMLGLPTETDEDLQGIIDVAKRIKALPVASGKTITVSVSTHVPKPHTPFQWAEQITPHETIRRQRLLAQGLKEAKVNFRYHDHFSSFMEGIFCRAGRELAPVIVKAYEMGCRLDAWQEHLNEEKWMQAFLECDINPTHYLRERALDEALPWDHLSCGIPKSYFLKEYKRATRDRTTPDCLTTSCSVCGACNYDTHKNILWPRHESEEWLAKRQAETEHEEIPNRRQDPVQKIRIKYHKKDNARFLGHLELVHVFHRATRRAEIPLCYSQGFHPLPKLAFGPPLSLGIASSADYVDASFYEHIEPEVLMDKLNHELPPSLYVEEAQEVELYGTSIQEATKSLSYQVEFLSEPRGLLGELYAQNGSNGTRSSIDFTEEEKEQLLALTVTRKGKKKKTRRGKRIGKDKQFVLRDYVSDLQRNVKGVVNMSIKSDTNVACPNVLEVVKEMTELTVGDCVIEKCGAGF